MTTFHLPTTACNQITSKGTKLNTIAVFIAYFCNKRDGDFYKTRSSAQSALTSVRIPGYDIIVCIVGFKSQVFHLQVRGANDCTVTTYASPHHQKLLLPLVVCKQQLSGCCS